MSKTNKKRLGRGLSALLNDEGKSSVKDTTTDEAKDILGQIMEIPMDAVEVNPNQPRTHFDKAAIEELAQSIRTLGIIQPITVRKEGKKFQIISGERRYRASQIAELESIPAYIRLADDGEVLEMALVENIQREDLDAIEIALSYERLIHEVSLTQEELSNRVGKDRTSITNYLRLLKLDPLVQSGIRDGIISMGHGRALATLEDIVEQVAHYETIVKKALSVRQTEELIKSAKKKAIASKGSSAKELPNQFRKALKDISDYLETDIQIQRAKNGKGKIIIPFTSDEDFDQIKGKLEN